MKSMHIPLGSLGRRAPLSLAALLLVLAVSCGSDQQNDTSRSAKEKNAVPTRDINAVLADQDDELLKLTSVVGVAVAELDDHTPCLLIMLSEDNAETRKKIPSHIEGHPTKIVVSGEIKPM